MTSLKQWDFETFAKSQDHECVCFFKKTAGSQQAQAKTIEGREGCSDVFQYFCTKIRQKSSGTSKVSKINSCIQETALFALLVKKRSLPHFCSALIRNSGWHT